jgi:hypothetical protein
LSFVTTPPEMLASAPSAANAGLYAGGSQDYPRDGAGMGGNRRVERRRNGRSGDSSMDVLTPLPAVGVLERIPVPTLAIARDGTILCTNTAFAEMMGYWQDGLAG